MRTLRVLATIAAVPSSALVAWLGALFAVDHFVGLFTAYVSDVVEMYLVFLLAPVLGASVTVFFVLRRDLMATMTALATAICAAIAFGWHEQLSIPLVVSVAVTAALLYYFALLLRRRLARSAGAN